MSFSAAFMSIDKVIRYCIMKCRYILRNSTTPMQRQLPTFEDYGIFCLKPHVGEATSRILEQIRHPDMEMAANILTVLDEDVLGEIYFGVQSTAQLAPLWEETLRDLLGKTVRFQLMRRKVLRQGESPTSILLRFRGSHTDPRLCERPSIRYRYGAFLPPRPLTPKLTYFDNVMHVAKDVPIAGYPRDETELQQHMRLFFPQFSP